jgi:hypothetical protein
MTKASAARPSSCRRVDSERSPAHASGSTALNTTRMRSPLQPLSMSTSRPRLHTAIIWSCFLSRIRLVNRVMPSLAWTKWLVYTTRRLGRYRLASRAV